MLLTTLLVALGGVRVAAVVTDAVCVLPGSVGGTGLEPVTPSFSSWCSDGYLQRLSLLWGTTWGSGAARHDDFWRS